MDVRSKQAIREHLQREDVQERILQSIQKGRNEATVTISRAAELFGITENKLRDWEEYGFLHPLRPGGPKGRRLYTPTELDNLAIIRELIDAGYAASDIPPDIQKLWQATRSSHERIFEQSDRTTGASKQTESDLTINARISREQANLFWRYYVSQALRLALLLVCADLPHTAAGIVLPLRPERNPLTIERIEDIEKVGEALVGWLSESRSSYTFLTERPSFQYSTDFRIEHLLSTSVNILDLVRASDVTLLVIEREAKALNVSTAVVGTLQRLLQPLYEEVERLRTCFGPGMRDMVSSVTDVQRTLYEEDTVLNGLAEMVVRLGGVTAEGHARWLFCDLLLPTHSSSFLSLQQRNLVVRAQSKLSPHILGITTYTPQEPFIHSSIKAYQSGHSIYLWDIPLKQEQTSAEGPGRPIRSSIALPLEGYDEVPSAVLYIASEQPHAFTEEDQRVLRLLGRMIKERLDIYETHLFATKKLRALISTPSIVDTRFQEFLAEDDFIAHVEMLLKEVQTREQFSPSEILSFIAVDIDNQSSVATKYGDRIAQELSRAVGLRIYSQLRAFKDEAEYKLYHIGADRFYILLDNMSLEQARTKAELLKQTLGDSYQIDPHRTLVGQAALLENVVTLANTTVRIGVSSYPYPKLKEVLLRYSPASAVAEMRMQITGFLEEVLALGKQKGGNIVLSWDPVEGFIRLPR